MSSRRGGMHDFDHLLWVGSMLGGEIDARVDTWLTRGQDG